jgi:hypothetical protein
LITWRPSAAASASVSASANSAPAPSRMLRSARAPLTKTDQHEAAVEEAAEPEAKGIADLLVQESGAWGDWSSD